jgi:biopolymer transport protein TolQ
MPNPVLLANLGENLPRLLADTGLFAKSVLVVLFVLSVTSWAVIIDRTRLYLLLRRNGRAVESAFHQGGLEGTLENLRRFGPSVERAILEEADRWRRVGSGGEMELREQLERRASEELSEMEKYLVFLATTTSVAPFLGLLGTVWGIMSSFMSMGIHGTASIEVIGPGIAEALVTTVAGLGTAIPTLVGYNLLVRHVRRQETRLDLFLSRVVTRMVGKPPESQPGAEASYAQKPVHLDQ